MHFLLSLMVIGLVVVAWVAICLRLVAWQNDRAAARDARAEREVQRDRRDRRDRRGSRPARGQRRLLLPEGHRPPPGLSPLSPSERFLTQEADRGLRELQMFLVDQRA